MTLYEYFSNFYKQICLMENKCDPTSTNIAIFLNLTCKWL